MNGVIYFKINHKPVHDCPFPVYPVLHVQMKLPAVLVQVALASQLWVLVEHSSMSKELKHMKLVIKNISQNIKH